MPSFSLHLKSLMLGTSMELPAKKLRWIMGATQRSKHPELWELYLEEQRLPLILQKVSTKSSHGVDVGCHIGSFLKLLLRHAPEGQHVAFEPSIPRGSMLKERFPAATVFPYAVSDKSGTAVFQEDLSQPGFSRLQGGSETKQDNLTNYTVQTCRLDDILLESKRLDLLKLDIEGGELAALRGGYQTLQKFRPAIIFECGTSETSEHTSSRQDLHDFITQQLGYDIFTFVDFLFDKGPLTFDEFRKCGIYPFRAFNFLALPRGDQRIRKSSDKVVNGRLDWRGHI